MRFRLGKSKDKNLKNDVLLEHNTRDIFLFCLNVHTKSLNLQYKSSHQRIRQYFKKSITTLNVF